MTETAGRPGASGLGRAATSGFIWLMVQSFAARGIGFVSQLVLARLLLPADFGVIGLAYTVTGIANTLVSFGIDDVLLQRQRTITLWMAPAFWLSFGLGMLGMVAMVGAAPIAAHLYHSHELIGLIVAIAVATPLRTLATVPSVCIRAAMNFRFLASYNTFEIFAIQALTIVFAFFHLGAFSFALPFPILGVVKAILFWRKFPPTIRRRFRPVQMRYLLSNSTIVFATKTVIEVINQGDYIILGLIATHDAVGLYFFAFRFSAQPVRMLAGNFNNVIFPALAQLRDDLQRQTEATVKACRLLSYLVMPFCFLQAGLAQPGLHFLFGERWIKAVPYVQILSLGLPFDAMSWITGSFMSARRQFWRCFCYAAISVPLFFGGAILGGMWDNVMGVAIAVGLYYLVYPPVTSFLVLCGSGVKPWTVAEFYGLPTIFSAIAVLAGCALASRSPFAGHDFAQCIVIGTVTVILYPTFLAIFRPDMLVQIRSRFGGIGNKLRRRVSATA